MSNSKQVDKRKSYLVIFLFGAILGLIISLIIGLTSYPWENPRFEGGAGYHMIAMFVLTPIITISSGVATILICYILRKFKSNR